MMTEVNNPDIRWKLRFQNFEAAFLRLKEAMEQESLNELERNGLIQRFEFTIELAWKTLKDLLEEEGYIIKSPKETIRQAFANGFIEDAQALLDNLEMRNNLSHDYSGEYFESVEPELRKTIYPALSKMYLALHEWRAM